MDARDTEFFQKVGGAFAESMASVFSMLTGREFQMSAAPGELLQIPGVAGLHELRRQHDQIVADVVRRRRPDETRELHRRRPERRRDDKILVHALERRGVVAARGRGREEAPEVAVANGRGERGVRRRRDGGDELGDREPPDGAAVRAVGLRLVVARERDQLLRGRRCDRGVDRSHRHRPASIAVARSGGSARVRGW